MDVSFRAIAVWQRNRDAFLRQWRSSLGGLLLEPFFILTAVGLGIGALVSGTDVGSESYAHFVAPGILAAYAMFHASFECTFGAYMRMETHRIVIGIIVTPVSAEDVALGELLWGATRSGLGAVAILTVATLLGLVDSPWAFLAVPMAALVGLMFASLALSLTAITPTMSLLENYFTLFVTPLFFFGGVFFSRRTPKGSTDHFPSTSSHPRGPHHSRFVHRQCESRHSSAAGTCRHPHRFVPSHCSSPYTATSHRVNTPISWGRVRGKPYKLHTEWKSKHIYVKIATVRMAPFT